MTEPDLIVHNAVVHTMDDALPAATAFAVTRGRIAAVGDSAQITALAGVGTRMVDAAGACVVPGLMDAHNHHSMAGEEDLYRLSFAPTATVDEICDAVAAWIREHELAPGEWVLGGIWGSTLVPELSTADPLGRLDAASPRNPVLLTDDSHHNKWANSLALAAAGIDDALPDPAGGKIVRDASGRATGLLFESAGALADQARAAAEGEPDIARLARCSERGIEMMHELGITAFQDAAATRELLEAFEMLDAEGRLKAWAVSSLLINDNIFGNRFIGRPLMERGEAHRTAHHRPDFTKIFLDGVPPTHTGAFLEPYLPSDAHGHDHRGATTMPIEEVEEWLRHADELGLGVKIHCTGDASVRMVLDAVERVRRDGLGLIVHIAHGQYIHPDDVPRFAQLGVVAEISPMLWVPGVIVDSLRSVLPEPFGDRLHPNRALLDSGATVVGGSDWPVAESPNPWHAIFGLVTREDPTGRFAGRQWPEQAITVREALAAYTSSSARAMNLADVAGRIAPGLSADFVLLSADPLAVDPVELKDIVARQTWFEGELVFERS
ncbi:amidohydrolase [Microbacterium sp. JZ31]|uniref:amidohydrolase n=1 Tax=Microbacterium sp. JZ31 TaxID=1906274 RepID=UPI001931AF29|nr:amidohydrolase [Microbacterium sp. JZ31]